ncbi:MAG: hypothetical protein HC917_01175 [Richelia sp. SM2_1_7]|nr:hypothetical protein [Richelia sp. SM2_1_7]
MSGRTYNLAILGHLALIFLAKCETPDYLESTGENEGKFKSANRWAKPSPSQELKIANFKP